MEWWKPHARWNWCYSRVPKTNDLQTIAALFVVSLKLILHAEDDLGLMAAPLPKETGCRVTADP